MSVPPGGHRPHIPSPPAVRRSRGRESAALTPPEGKGAAKAATLTSGSPSPSRRGPKGLLAQPVAPTPTLSAAGARRAGPRGRRAGRAAEPPHQPAPLHMTAPSCDEKARPRRTEDCRLLPSLPPAPHLPPPLPSGADGADHPPGRRHSPQPPAAEGERRRAGVALAGRPLGEGRRGGGSCRRRSGAVGLSPRGGVGSLRESVGGGEAVAAVERGGWWDGAPSPARLPRGPPRRWPQPGWCAAPRLTGRPRSRRSCRGRRGTVVLAWWQWFGRLLLKSQLVTSRKLFLDAKAYSRQRRAPYLAGNVSINKTMTGKCSHSREADRPFHSK